MGNCEASSCSPDIQHPILGQCKEVTLQGKRLLRVSSKDLTRGEFLTWEQRMRKLKERNPKISDVVFMCVYVCQGKSFSLNPVTQFYFQNYYKTLEGEKMEARSGKNLTEHLIRNVGKTLFQLYELCPELEEELTLRNVVLNQREHAKVLIRKWLPPIGTPPIKPSLRNTKARWMDDTQTGSCSHSSIHEPKTMLAQIYQLLLSLVKQNYAYSSQFIHIISLLKTRPSNPQELISYFLEKPITSRNYLLQTSYIDNINNVSDITSLFLVTESGWTDNYPHC